MATPLIHAFDAADERRALGWRMWVPCFGIAWCLRRQALVNVDVTRRRPRVESCSGFTEENSAWCKTFTA